MDEHDVKGMVHAAVRRARFRKPTSIEEFAQFFVQEMELELAEAWGRQRGYC